MDKGIRVYIPIKQAEIYKQESQRLGVDVADLIRIKLEQSDREKQILEDLSKRLHQCESMLVWLGELFEAQAALAEAGAIDAGYLRGAIEVQASSSAKAVKRAEEIELQRHQIAREIRENLRLQRLKLSNGGVRNGHED